MRYPPEGVRGVAGSPRAAGILLPKPDWIEMVADFGFTFVAVGSDGAAVSAGLSGYLQALTSKKQR